MLCEFSLPSQPEKKIRLKEATVSDAIDFSGIDPDCEEQATTVFLERVQERDTYSDPRLWTGEDRRFALFTQRAVKPRPSGRGYKAHLNWNFCL